MPENPQTHPKLKPGTASVGDWYDLPHYYDIIFDQDTGVEADFLEAVWKRFGDYQTKGQRPLRVLEPACGSGRLVLELAKRGHLVEGFDANPHMLAAAQNKLTHAKLRAPLRRGRLEVIPSKDRYELAHCLLSTFKYIRTERDALNHLRQVAAQLVRGGIYVLGIHLTDYARTRVDSETWTGTRDGCEVTCETKTFPPDRRRRSEKLSNRLMVRAKKSMGQRRPPAETTETRWMCRTYDATQLRSLLAKVPEFRCVACFDFTYNLSSPRKFDDSQEDIVLILAKNRSPNR